MEYLAFVYHKGSNVQDDKTKTTHQTKTDGGIFVLETNTRTITTSLTFGIKEELEATRKLTPVGSGLNMAGHSTRAPKGFYGLSGSKALIWHLEWSKGIVRSPLRIGHKYATSTTLSSITTSKDGALIISGDKSGRVLAWDGLTGKLVKEWKAHTGQILNCGLIEDDGTLITVGIEDATINLYLTSDIYGKKDDVSNLIQPWKTVRFPEGSHSIKDIVVLNGMNWGAYGSSTTAGMTIAVIDKANLFIVSVVPNNTSTCSKSDRVRINLPEEATSLACSPDGMMIAVGMKNGSIRMYSTSKILSEERPSSSALEDSFEGHSGSVTALNFSYFGDSLYSAATDGIREWDLTTTPVLTRHIYSQFNGGGRIDGFYGFYVPPDEELDNTICTTIPNEGLQRTTMAKSCINDNPCYYNQALRTELISKDGGSEEQKQQPSSLELLDSMIAISRFNESSRKYQ